MDMQNKLTQLINSQDIEQWLIIYLSDLLDISQDEIDPQAPFDSYGLDSAAAVGMTGDLGDWLHADLEPTLLYEYPTIRKLTEFLVGALDIQI
jgi:acyl carrier protein